MTNVRQNPQLCITLHASLNIIDAILIKKTFNSNVSTNYYFQPTEEDGPGPANYNVDGTTESKMKNEPAFSFGKRINGKIGQSSLAFSISNLISPFIRSLLHSLCYWLILWCGSSLVCFLFTHSLIYAFINLIFQTLLCYFLSSLAFRLFISLLNCSSISLFGNFFAHSFIPLLSVSLSVHSFVSTFVHFFFLVSS